MGGMASLVAVVPVGIAFLAALILAPWDKTIIVEPFVWDHTPTPSTADVNKPEFSRRTVYFPSHGLQLEGWLYMPKVSSIRCCLEALLTLRHATCNRFQLDWGCMLRGHNCSA